MPSTITFVDIFGFLRTGPLRVVGDRSAEVGSADMAASPAESFRLWETKVRREMPGGDDGERVFDPEREDWDR